VCLAAPDQAVEALALAIEKLFIIPHSHAHPQTILHVAVEVDQVWIDVIQQRLPGLQSKHDSEAAAKRLDISTLRVCVPDWFQMRDEPTFATRPFERRLQL
jgi:hypothetical protein